MTRRAEKIRAPAERPLRLPVEMVDERYSSAEVESRMRAALRQAQGGKPGARQDS
jgi:RNase H-fold protein (predicted Holliday junction resolvase)